MRPKSDHSKIKMDYSIVAPRMYEGKIESLVSTHNWALLT